MGNMITLEELSRIERELQNKLAAPATREAQTDLVDYATRSLNRLIAASKQALAVNAQQHA
jgi:hypothetical protein